MNPDAARKEEGGGNHRVLIFCQLKGLLDLVEDELFGSMLRGVSFLRLDGGAVQVVCSPTLPTNSASSVRARQLHSST